MTALTREELQYRESLYRVLARNLPGAAVFLFDRDLRCQIVEGQLLAAQGLDSTMLEGKRVEEIYPDLNALHAQYREALNGTDQQHEYHQTNGAILRLHTMPIRDANGEIAGCMGVAQDVTAARRAEAALRESESRHRALLNALPDVMFVQNAEGKFTELHTVRIENALADGEILLGKTVRSLGMSVKMEDIFLRHIQQSIKTGEIQTFEFTIGSSDQDLQYYEARMVALDDEEVMTIARNITAFKRIQEELSSHIEDLTILRQVDSEASEKLNIEYVLDMVLDACLRLGNATAGFIALYEEGYMTLAHALGAYDLEQVNERLQNKDSVYHHTMQELKPRLIMDPEKVPGYVTLLKPTQAVMLIPLVSQENPVGLINLEARKATQFTRERFQMVQLITGRTAAMLDNARLYRQTNQQLAELQNLYKQVSKLEQLKTDMIRIASHDLRNPLAATLGYLDMLRWDAEKSFNDTQVAFMKNIETAVRKMQTITTGILSLERIEQMAQNQNMESLDLAALVKRAYDENTDSAQQKQQKLALENSPEPMLVQGDTFQLHEAVHNLISNAIKYTPEEGSVRVTVEQQGDQACLRVIDTGYGIPESQQQRIFEPFFRARTQENQAIEGTGLGLHLVKNIIERHDGKMVFKSVRGEGSTFGFDLPINATPRKPTTTGATVIG
jgi:PAS domain S-box-containing protein